MANPTTMAQLKVDGACIFCSVIETYVGRLFGTKKGAPFKPFITVKMDEENPTYAGLAQENGFGSEEDFGQNTWD